MKLHRHRVSDSVTIIDRKLGDILLPHLTEYTTLVALLANASTPRGIVRVSLLGHEVGEPHLAGGLITYVSYIGLHLKASSGTVRKFRKEKGYV